MLTGVDLEDNRNFQLLLFTVINQMSYSGKFFSNKERRKYFSFRYQNRLRSGARQANKRTAKFLTLISTKNL